MKIGQFTRIGSRIWTEHKCKSYSINKKKTDILKKSWWSNVQDNTYEDICNSGVSPENEHNLNYYLFWFDIMKYDKLI